VSGQPGQPAYPVSGQPGYPVSGQPGQPSYPVSGQPGYPISAQPYPTSAAPYSSAPGYPGAPGYPPQAPPKKGKGLMITGIVLGVLLLLCGGGGVAAYVLTKNTEGTGATSAKEATQTFLDAIYKKGDAAAAEKLVCEAARDRKAIDEKIKQVKDEKAKLKSPNFTWETPKLSNETATEATATVTVKLTTTDEKMSEQALKLILVKHDGWFVCEVQQG
jgi:flagellar basal body-associated protein FliL